MKQLIKTTLMLALLVGCAAPSQTDTSSGLTAFEEFSALSHAEARAHYHSLDEAGQLALWEESWVLALESADGAERMALEYALENIDSLALDPEAAQDELMTLVGQATFTTHFASLGPLFAGPASFVAPSEIPVVDGVGGSTAALADGSCDSYSTCGGTECYDAIMDSSALPLTTIRSCSANCSGTSSGCGLFGWFSCSSAGVTFTQVLGSCASNGF